jgi:hypothetical protein
MADNPELPQTRTTDPIETPPMSKRSTTAQLKADIDSGATGDKTQVFDPGLSPLGTDDEAAGRPPSQKRIDLARYHERFSRWAQGGRKTIGAHEMWDGSLTGFASFIVAVGVILVGAIWSL